MHAFVSWFNDVYDEAKIEKLLEGIDVYLSGVVKQMDKVSEKNNLKKSKNKRQLDEKQTKADQLVKKATQDTLEKCRHRIDAAVLPLSSLLSTARISHCARFSAGEKIYMSRSRNFLKDDLRTSGVKASFELPKLGVSNETSRKKASRSPLQLFYGKTTPSRTKSDVDHVDEAKDRHPPIVSQKPNKRGLSMNRGTLVKSRDPWEQVCSFHLDV